MNECPNYDMTCRGEFCAIHRKLEHLDEAIRGNGKPGIQLRLDRLEQNEAWRKRVTWIVIGALVSILASDAMQFFQVFWMH
ncbi:MAG: hypothetical protein FWD61_01250 [Phycisphaerales bacterium]|nr:hypothetical protein [Phycisphaerales bacterium]